MQQYYSTLAKAFDNLSDHPLSRSRDDLIRDLNARFPALKGSLLEKPSTYAVEASQSPESFEVRVPLAGLSDDDVSLVMHEDHYSINVTGKKKPVGCQAKFPIEIQKAYVPECYDDEKLEASMAHGVLTLTFAKRPEEPKKEAFKEIKIN